MTSKEVLSAVEWTSGRIAVACWASFAPRATKASRLASTRSGVWQAVQTTSSPELPATFWIMLLSTEISAREACTLIWYTPECMAAAISIFLAVELTAVSSEPPRLRMPCSEHKLNATPIASEAAKLAMSLKHKVPLWPFIRLFLCWIYRQPPMETLGQRKIGVSADIERGELSALQ